jgi:deoxyribodipyrimidine photo-lyase
MPSIEVPLITPMARWSRSACIGAAVTDSPAAGKARDQRARVYAAVAGVSRRMTQLSRYASRQFTPTRAEGLARLADFLPRAGRAYANDRNSDLGPDRRGNVSVLSPFIRHRLITEEEVLAAVLARFSLSSADKYVQEVFWRTYFKGHLETRPQIWQRYRADVERLLPQFASGGAGKAYAAAIEGRTGIDAFDAWAEELVETGYLHNHARMWFASVWIFTLKLPWQLGADFTLRHFLDGDPASNTLSWRWVGGLHTKGKTYLARRDNIAGYTGGRFSPTGLAREAPPLDEEPMGPARALPPVEPWPNGRIGLLLHEDDLHAESLDLPGPIVAVAGATVTAERSPSGVPDSVARFAEGAVADGLERAGRHFAAPTLRLASLSPVCVADFARAHRLDAVVTPYAPVGPVAEALAAIAGSRSHPVRLARVRRPFDTVAWPHGTRGFFALKERIPDLVREAGLERASETERQPELF